MDRRRFLETVMIGAAGLAAKPTVPMVLARLRANSLQGFSYIKSSWTFHGYPVYWDEPFPNIQEGD